MKTSLGPDLATTEARLGHGKRPRLTGPGRVGVPGKDPVSAGAGWAGVPGKDPVSAGSGRAGVTVGCK
jgi:hypothetical protein